MQKFRRFRDYIFTQKHRDFLGCFWVKMPASPTRVTTINGAEMAVRLGHRKQARSLPFLHAIPHSEQLFIEKYNTTSALRLGPSSLWRKRHEFLKSIIVSSAGREYLEYVYFGILSRARSARTQRGYCFQVHCHHWAVHRGQFWSEDVPLENFRKMMWLGCMSFSDTLELSIRFR